MIRLFCALASGALLAAAFPSIDAASAAWIALAPLIVLSITAPSVRRATAEGYACGLAFHCLTFFWWYTLLTRYGRLSYPEAAGVYLILQGYLAAYFALFAGGIRLIESRLGAAWALAMSPPLWAGLEMIRGRLFTGLPWSVLGASQHAHPLLIQTADLGGVHLVSLVVAAGNAALAGVILIALSRRSGRSLPGMGRILTVLVAIPPAAVAYGAARLSVDTPRADTLRVGLIQGNVPQDEKWEASARIRILDAHEEATREAARQGARLVVWPESSVPLPLTEEPSYRLRLESLARSLGVDLLVGSVHYGGALGGAVEERAVYPGAGEERFIHNSAFLIGSGDKEGDHARYDKIHLVPFGEYVPLHRWLGPVDKLVMEAGDFTPGSSVVVMKTGPACVAPLVCFEAIFPSLVRRFTCEGAQVIVNITNDAFLGDTSGPRQHLALATLRTVESRRWLVRAANTGISAIVDERGRIVQAADYGKPAVLVGDVPLLEGSTIYMSLGDAPLWGCVILAVASLIAPTRRTGGTSWTRNC